MERIAEIMDGLHKSIGIVTELIKSVPESRLLARRKEGCWSVAEHAVHLGAGQKMLYERMDRFFKEDVINITPYFPPEETDAPLPGMADVEEALQMFATWREKQLELLGRAGEAEWNKKAIHPEYEAYTLYIVARHILLHDYWHLYRMEQLWLTTDAYFEG